MALIVLQLECKFLAEQHVKEGEELVLIWALEDSRRRLVVFGIRQEFVVELGGVAAAGEAVRPSISLTVREREDRGLVKCFASSFANLGEPK